MIFNMKYRIMSGEKILKAAAIVVFVVIRSILRKNRLRGGENLSE